MKMLFQKGVPTVLQSLLTLFLYLPFKQNPHNAIDDIFLCDIILEKHHKHPRFLQSLLCKKMKSAFLFFIF